VDGTDWDMDCTVDWGTDCTVEYVDKEDGMWGSTDSHTVDGKSDGNPAPTELQCDH
jgi:hypothetical protein